MTIVRALMCAAKIKQGQKCSVSEMAAALDTLAWAYKNRAKIRKSYSDQKAHEKKLVRKTYKRKSRY